MCACAEAGSSSPWPHKETLTAPAEGHNSPISHLLLGILALDMYKANPRSSMSRHSSSWILLDPRSRPELGCESLQVPATWQARLQSQHLRGRTSHCYPTSCPSLTALSSTACAISVLLGTDLTGDAPKSGPSACPCQKAASCVASSCRVTVASLPWDCLQ